MLVTLIFMNEDTWTCWSHDKIEEDGNYLYGLFFFQIFLPFVQKTKW